MVDSLKIIEIFIENYKMFKNFKIDFLDKDGKPLDVVVIAGINGTGKTTLLEFIKNLIESDTFDEITSEKDYIEIQKGFEIVELYHKTLLSSSNNSKFSLKILENVVFYFNSFNKFTHNILKDIEIKLSDFYINRAKELDSFKKSLKEIENLLDNIFTGLELKFTIKDIDFNNKKVLFTNKKGEHFSIDKLSEGEKTLLSKVFYLYINNLKNSIILIDEPELSLHPSWQNKILKIYENFAREYNCQIIVATHSPHIIGSAKNGAIRVLNFDQNNNLEVLKDLDNV